MESEDGESKKRDGTKTYGQKEWLLEQPPERKQHRTQTAPKITGTLNRSDPLRKKTHAPHIRKHLVRPIRAERSEGATKDEGAKAAAPAASSDRTITRILSRGRIWRPLMSLEVTYDCDTIHDRRPLSIPTRGSYS